MAMWWSFSICVLDMKTFLQNGLLCSIDYNRRTVKDRESTMVLWGFEIFWSAAQNNNHRAASKEEFILPYTHTVHSYSVLRQLFIIIIFFRSERRISHHTASQRQANQTRPIRGKTTSLKIRIQDFISHIQSYIQYTDWREMTTLLILRMCI